MKTIIAALITAMSELKTKADSALKGMGPLDQYQGAQEVGYAINSLNYSKEVVEDMLVKANSIMEKYDATIADAAAPIAATLIDEKITAGELVRKTDFDIAIDGAEKKGEQVATARFEAEKKAEVAIAARRTEVSAAHGQPVADALTPEILAAEEFDTKIKPEIARRVEAVNKLGIVAAEKPEQYKDILICGKFDDEGSAEFDKRITLITSLLPSGTVAASAPAKKVIPGSGAPQIVTAPAGNSPAAKEEAVVSIF